MTVQRWHRFTAAVVLGGLLGGAVAFTISGVVAANETVTELAGTTATIALTLLMVLSPHQPERPE